MYDKLLKRVEKWFNDFTRCMYDYDDDLKGMIGSGVVKDATAIADLIVKIKTIQALDTNAELINAGRKAINK
jgi:hypothetical protein